MILCVCVCVSECVFIPSREGNDEIQKEKKMTKWQNTKTKKQKQKQNIIEYTEVGEGMLRVYNGVKRV